MEDLQHILPEQLKQVPNKKIYLVLSIFIGFFFLLSIALGCALVVKHVQNQGGKNGFGPGEIAALVAYPPKPPPGVCVSPECLKTAAWIAENLNRSVDPCDNFYQYACGGWLEKVSIPEGRSAYTVNSILNDANEEKLRELIQSRIPVNSQSKTERKLKDFYRSCIHDYGRMEEGGKVVIDIIRNKFGGWYALDPDNWQSSQWDSSAALTSAMSDYLVKAMFRIDVTVDRRNRSRNIIMVRSSYLGMYSNYYLQDDKAHVQEKYKTFMKDTARLLLRDANVTLNESKREEAIQTFADDAYFHEKQIAIGITLKRRQPNYYRSTIITIGELMRNYSQIDWLQILRGYFGPDITSDTFVYVREKPYFDMIDAILRNETENKNRILNNFLVWTFVDTYGHHLSWEYRINAQYFNEPFRGPSDMVPSWMQCVDTIEARLGSLLVAEFIKTHVGTEGRQQVSDLFQQMKTVSSSVIDNMSFMDNVTKSRAKEKLDKLKALIGFPDEYFDQSYLDRLHSVLVINRTLGYLTNLMNTNVFVKKQARILLDAGKKYYLWTYATRRGAFRTTFLYFYGSHVVLVPVSAMQFPYMTPKKKNIIASGGIGTRVGQAFYFSISDIGRSVWHNGSWWNWWTDSTYGDYIKSRGCFKDYMTSQRFGPFLINGENITINLKPYSASRLMREMVGVKFAYQTAVSDKTTIPKLPLGSDMSREQGFFLSYAQSKCGKRTDYSKYTRIRYSSYTEETGVNSILSQMPEFASAYQCAANKPMNLQNRCTFV